MTPTTKQLIDQADSNSDLNKLLPIWFASWHTSLKSPCQLPVDALCVAKEQVYIIMQQYRLLITIICLFCINVFSWALTLAVL